MIRFLKSSWWNALSVQIGWWVSVLAAADGRPWIGPPVVILLVTLHLWTCPSSPTRRRDAVTVLTLGAIGTAIDSAQVCAGLLRFEAAPAPCLCPIWIVALWLHFGITPRSSLAFLRRRPWLGALFGGIAGPAAFYAGERLGAVAFHPELWPSLLSLSVIWAGVIPALVAFAWRQEDGATDRAATGGRRGASSSRP
ncbi:MAG: DUF2878 domain-containing protein [Acidobacteriota bacterium]